MPIIKVSECTKESSIAISCIICGENVLSTMAEEMASSHRHHIFKVCDECKKAVMKMRKLTHQHEDKGE